MSERWQRELLRLREVDLPKEVWERATHGPRHSGGPPRHRRLVAALVATVVAVAGATTAWLAFGRGGSDPRPVQLGGDPVVEAVIPLGGTPGSLAFLEGRIWVGLNDEVVAIDPATNEIVSRVDGYGGPIGVGFGSVWAMRPDVLARIEPATGEVVAEIPLPNPLDRSGEFHTVPSGIVAWNDQLLVHLSGSSVGYVDPQTNAVTRTEGFDADFGEIFGLKVTPDGLWILYLEAVEFRGNGSSPRIAQTTDGRPLPPQPHSWTVGSGASWLGFFDGTVQMSQLVARPGGDADETRTVNVGEGVVGLTYSDDGLLWVVTYKEGGMEVLRPYDADTMRPLGPGTNVGQPGTSLQTRATLAAEGSLWISDSDSESLVRVDPSGSTQGDEHRRAVVATGEEDGKPWTFIVRLGQDGWCLELEFGPGTGGACGFGVPPKAVGLAAADQDGVTFLQLALSKQVARVEVELEDGRVFRPEKLSIPPELGAPFDVALEIIRQPLGGIVRVFDAEDRILGEQSFRAAPDDVPEESPSGG